MKLVTRRTVANVIGESLAASTSISSCAAQADALCWTLMISNSVYKGFPYNPTCNLEL
jgi:hypothetical protein